jgi:hypothetical protein
MIVGALITLVGFIITTYLSVKLLTEEVDKDDKDTSMKPLKRFTYFFAMIYLIVAGFAVTNSLETYSENEKLDKILAKNIMDQEDLQNVLILISFIVTAVPFFHSGLTFLATDASEYLTRGHGRLVFPNFVILFFDAILIFFMAGSIDNLDSFVKITIALMVTDICWVISYIRNREVVFIEWLHYNFLTTLFLILFLIIGLPNHTPSVYSFLFHGLIFIILLTRTICDYKFGWKRLYFKHPLVEM